MKALILLLFAPLVATWRGYVFSVLWLWFIVPVFNAPTLRIPYAIGIAVTVGMITHHTNKSEDDPDPIYLLIVGTFAPLLMLGAAWIVTLFI